MWEKICLTGLFCLLWMAGLWLASKCGSKSARIDALKEEIKKQLKEQEKSNAINKRVDDMPVDDVRKRLQDIKHD